MRSQSKASLSADQMNFDHGALAGSLPPHRVEPLWVSRCEITWMPQRAGIGNCAR